MRRLTIGRIEPGADFRERRKIRIEHAVTHYLVPPHMPEALRDGVRGAYRAILYGEGDSIPMITKNELLRHALLRKVLDPHKIVEEAGKTNPADYTKRIAEIMAEWKAAGSIREVYNDLIGKVEMSQAITVFDRKGREQAAIRDKLLDEVTTGIFDPELLKDLLMAATRSEAEKLVDHLLNASSLVSLDNRFNNVLGHAYQYGPNHVREVVQKALNAEGFDEANVLFGNKRKKLLRESISAAAAGTVIAGVVGFLIVNAHRPFLVAAGSLVAIGVAVASLILSRSYLKQFKKEPHEYYFKWNSHGPHLIGAIRDVEGPLYPEAA